ncbi:NifU N-terminal domain-containing protein [Salisediminibacterium selenitireducens]|uniref:Scaffold protein Nfu/NifU n=1 Tax=Bacillus selenitireducens (strain ATCC 700615 / DSM 15326 / MLS10) TaxID=439292 RepID=D6XT93_BACIE|nr:NifU N-terminal domain-containing protein [Salisediminibacterium selenitireducens]ADH99029.1 Scaffold protein Nfu/NifU [[Bacillus] selenitireducens MLS10]
MAIEVRGEPTPNPNAMKFTANQVLFEGSGSASFKKGQETDHALAKELLSLDGVDNIFGFQDFVTVNKEPGAEWDDLLPKIQESFEKVYD